MFTSDVAGNGKTHQILREINRQVEEQLLVEKRKEHFRSLSKETLQITQNQQKNLDPSKPLVDGQKEKQLRQEVKAMAAQREQAVQAQSEKIVISGFVNSELIQRRMARVRDSQKTLKFLHVQIDFLENVASQGYVLNDFVFNLCVFRFFQFDDEPFFLPRNVQIFVEVSCYLDNFIYKNVVNLRLFRRVHVSFDLQSFDLNRNCRFEDDTRIVTEFYRQCVRASRSDQLSFSKANVLSSFSKQSKIKREFRKELESRQTKEMVQEAFSELFVEPLKKLNRKPTFSLMKLFCKIASHELRNLNSSYFFQISENHPQFKADIMRLMLKLVVRNILPSASSRLEQEKTSKTMMSTQE